MSILLLTVEKGSFTAAAKALNMPLPTVSRKLRELETHLGTQLLVRSTRKLALTDAGATYVGAARRILREIDHAERVASGEFEAPRGELVITAPILFGQLHVLPIVTEFLATYPEISVRLLLSDRNLHLIEDHVDMAVRIGTLPDSSMVATRVGAMPTVVCASPTLLATRGTPKLPDDLAAFPCVTFDAFAPRAIWTFTRGDGSGTVEIPITPRLSVTTAAAAVWAAMQGIGATRLFLYQCADALRQGDLLPILRDFQLDPAPVSLLHAARGALPLKMRVFLDFATGRLRTRLIGLGQSMAE
ncbi:LysR substrate-binding domain-containing protein [Aquabacter cavernae]|uniref:LysR substrate-binding domain-containing protein n=1 Tax=Aquabacter cavernae TaxID=2496029 RepID=UPI0030846050